MNLWVAMVEKAVVGVDGRIEFVLHEGVGLLVADKIVSMQKKYSHDEFINCTNSN